MTTTQHQPLTAVELAAMKARVEAATPGPWRGICAKWPEEDEETAANVYYGLHIPEGVASKANAEMLGEARQDLPRLIAEVERLNNYIASQQKMWDGNFTALPDILTENERLRELEREVNNCCGGRLDLCSVTGQTYEQREARQALGQEGEGNGN